MADSSTLFYEDVSLRTKFSDEKITQVQILHEVEHGTKEISKLVKTSRNVISNLLPNTTKYEARKSRGHPRMFTSADQHLISCKVINFTIAIGHFRGELELLVFKTTVSRTIRRNPSIVW